MVGDCAFFFFPKQKMKREKKKKNGNFQSKKGEKLFFLSKYTKEFRYTAFTSRISWLEKKQSKKNKPN